MREGPASRRRSNRTRNRTRPVTGPTGYGSGTAAQGGGLRIRSMRQVPTGGDMDRPMPERAQARADDQTGQSTLQLSLRPVRVVLSGAFLALILASGGGGSPSLPGGPRGVFFPRPPPGP